MDTSYRQRQTFLLVLALALFLVGCQSTQASAKPTPTATATATATATPTATATQILPTATPAGPPPTWSMSTTAFTLTNQGCPPLPGGGPFACALTISYDSMGSNVNAPWKVYLENPAAFGYITIEPSDGTLNAPTDSAQVSIYVPLTYCQNGIGSDIDVEVSNALPSQLQVVKLHCP
jgi:hypothetical protein